MKRYALPFAAAFCVLAAAPAALAEDPAPRRLVVTGQGEASAAPDMATLSIGVETEGDTAAAALSRNAQQMRATIDRLKKSGVAEKDMQTSNLSVSPRYNYEQRDAPPRITGYVATNMLTVKLRDIGKAGAVIDEAVRDGANSLGGLYFGFKDSKDVESEARAAAVADARARAETLARAAGVALGPIMQIQEGYAASPPQPYMDARVMKAEAASTPIAPGESTISASVTLVYEIR